MPAEKNLKISAEDDEQLELLSRAYKAPKGFLAGVLLRYGLSHRQEAIDEWRSTGEARLNSESKVARLRPERRA